MYKFSNEQGLPECLPGKQLIVQIHIRKEKQIRSAHFI